MPVSVSAKGNTQTARRGLPTDTPTALTTGACFDGACDDQGRTLDAIAAAAGDPHASVSAQLRHLRKPRVGGYTVEKRYRGAAARGRLQVDSRAPESTG